MRVAPESTGPDGAAELLQIAAWLDGRLDAARAERVERLLAADRELLGRVLALRELHAEPVAAAELLRAQALVAPAPRRPPLGARCAAALAAWQRAPVAVAAMMTAVTMAGSLWLGALASQELRSDELASQSLQEITRLDFNLGDGAATE